MGKNGFRVRKSFFSEKQRSGFTQGQSYAIIVKIGKLYLVDVFMTGWIFQGKKLTIRRTKEYFVFVPTAAIADILSAINRKPA